MVTCDPEVWFFFIEDSMASKIAIALTKLFNIEIDPELYKGCQNIRTSVYEKC